MALVLKPPSTTVAHLTRAPGRATLLARAVTSPPIHRPTPISREDRSPLSAILLTKDSEALLEEVLASLSWCAEILVLDTGSTDRTTAIAASFDNVTLRHLRPPFPGFGQAKRYAVALARHDWIFSVDSDEIVTAGLRDEIRRLPLDPRRVYTVPFQNHFNGKHITTCGWWPDRHERLFNRQSTNFCGSAVHERVGISGLAVTPLKSPIQHYSYRSLEDFLHKMHVYSRLFAQQKAGQRKSGTLKAVLRSTWAFFKSYVVERGILQGTEGLIISAYKAQTVFWKYLLLAEANRERAAAKR